MTTYQVVDCGSNATDEQCIEEQWGQAATYSVPHLAVLTAALLLIFCIGCIGNLITCAVIVRSQFMRTATNFYLFNLSLSDLVVLWSRLPFDLLTHWRRYPFPESQLLCVGSGFLAETCTYCSALTVTTLTVERYCAICRPMQARRGLGLSRSVKAIAASWLISACLSGVMSSQLGFEVLIRNDSSTAYIGRVLPESRICEVTKTRRIPYSFLASSLLLFVGPMLLMACMYVRIGAVVHRSLNPPKRKSSAGSVHSHTSDERRAVQKARGRKTLLKLLVGIVLAFFLCYAPFHLSRILADVVPKEAFCSDCAISRIQQALFHVSGPLFFGSSIANPILYNLMSLKFRRAFRGVMLRLIGRGPATQARKPQARQRADWPGGSCRLRRLPHLHQPQEDEEEAVCLQTLRQARPAEVSAGAREAVSRNGSKCSVNSNSSRSDSSQENIACSWRRHRHSRRLSRQQNATLESRGSQTAGNSRNLHCQDHLISQKLSMDTK